MGQLNKIGKGLRPRSTMTLRFLKARLKHYIICWDRLNSCYSEEFTKLIGCCRFNWRRIQSWHTKRGNIIDKVNSRGRYKKRVKMISSLCQNNPLSNNTPSLKLNKNFFLFNLFHLSPTRIFIIFVFWQREVPLFDHFYGLRVNFSLSIWLCRDSAGGVLSILFSCPIT